MKRSCRHREFHAKCESCQLEWLDGEMRTIQHVVARWHAFREDTAIAKCEQIYQLATRALLNDPKSNEPYAHRRRRPPRL